MKALMMASSLLFQLLVCISLLLFDGLEGVDQCPDTVSDCPVKPVNVTCMTRQSPSTSDIPPNIRCWWDTVGEETNNVNVTYTLNVLNSNKPKTTSTKYKNASVNFYLVFPYYMDVTIWVEAGNQLGKKSVSDCIQKVAQSFVKTNPPSNIRATSQKGSPNTLQINWTAPVPDFAMTLNYEIRFCAEGSSSWSNVSPLGGVNQPYTLENLQPYTDYIIQVRCRYSEEGLHWSDWSMNVTKKTPEDAPSSKPDIWRIFSDGDDVHERWVKFICKDPATPNGRIQGFNLTIQEGGHEGKDIIRNAAVPLESVYVNRLSGDGSATNREITELKEIQLADSNKAVTVFVAAVNAVGCSPKAELTITTGAHFLPPVENLKVWPEHGQLWVEWTVPSSGNASEYVVEWVNGKEMDWQRESRGTNRTVITGNLKSFVRYNISVVPIFSGWVGKPTTSEAYLEEGAPLEDNKISLNGPRDFTKNDGQGKVADIVICVSLILFVLLMVLLCFCKKAVIKNYWIPNPKISSIGVWSPSYPVKSHLHPQVETPRLSPLSNICVLDQCEPKRAPEEYQAQKRSTKYPGEEQSSSSSSSGSCSMSAPASHSHQSGSSVAAFGGYKGQTPTLHFQTPQLQGVFAPSESTLPLLESEEMLYRPHQEAGGAEGSQQEALEPLAYCPAVEGPSAESFLAPLPSKYMPQLGSYRPQISYYT